MTMLTLPRTKLTLETLTDSQITTLRTEASQAGDWAMSGICDVALDGRLNDGNVYETLTTADRQPIGRMDQDAARSSVVAAINEAAAQGCSHAGDAKP